MLPIISTKIVLKAGEAVIIREMRKSSSRNLRPHGRSTCAVALAALLTLVGCGDFFVKENSGGGGGGSTGKYVYVANATTSTVAGFSIGTSKLTAVNGSPLSLGYVPLALAVSRSNSFLFVAGAGAVYRYTINSDGSLSTPSTGAGVAALTEAALDTSPDGQWLFGLNSVSNVLDEFKIDTSTGNLTVAASTPYTPANGTVLQRAVKVAPTGNLIFAALGTAGDVVFTLNTSTGAVAQSQTLAPASSTSSDNDLAVNSAVSYLYIARSGTGGGVAVYKVGANGQLDSISGSPFAAGNQPWAIALDSTGKYVYAANRSENNITGYAIGTNSALTALSGSPYTSGTLVNSLAASGTYLFAGANGGNPDLSMYTFDSTTAGKLNLATSTATDTNPAGVVSIAVSY